MRNGFKICVWFFLFAALASLSFAGRRGSDCKKVSGRLIETQIGAPAPPRVIGRTTGTLNGVETAYIVSIDASGFPNSVSAETVNTFVTDAGDVLVTEGHAEVTPIDNDGTVRDVLTLTILPDQSLGRYAGATGTITLDGIGYKFPIFSPEAGPGNTYFIFRYKGTICGIDNDDHDEDWD